MSNNKPKLWTRDFVGVSVVHFLLLLVFYLLIVTIALYAVEEYGASTSEAGLVTGIFILGALAGRLVIGRTLDMIGRKRALVLGSALFVGMTALYFLPLGLPFLMLNRFLHGVTLGVASTAAGTIAAQVIPHTRKGEGIGYFSMSATLGAAFGPFIGLLMSQWTGYTMIFAACVAIALSALALSTFVKVPPLEKPPAGEVKSGFQLSNYLEANAVPIAIVMFLIALSYSSVLSFINFYANDKGLVEAASFFFLVYAVVILLTRPFTGRIMDLYGANYIMYPALVSLAAGLLLLSVADSSLGLLFAGALIGLGFGNMQSTTQAVAIKLTPPHRMGLATSTFFVAMDGGLGMGPYILGFIIPFIGYSSLYGLLGVAVFTLIVPYYFLHGKKERQLSASAR